MSLTKLNCKLEKITHIVHLADIHIRLTKRFDEYTEVFEKLYEGIRNTPETTIVCIVGDIVHNKSDLSPECVHYVKDFLRNIANIRPTVLVAGNHDHTVSNRSRMDSLSPIVDAINHPNLFYLKKSGLYSIGNLLLNNMSIFDDQENYTKWEDIPKVCRNSHDRIIALFHGPIHNAITDLGYVISSKSHPVSMFHGHDMVLLGDIHKMQDLQFYDPEEGLPFVRYCGSLIMQNHGEDLLGHGYSLWDVNKVNYKHIEIPNDYSHFTVDIEKGKLKTNLKDIPKKARLRIRCFESIATEVKAVLAAIKKVSEISDISYQRIASSNDQKPNKDIADIISGNLSDTEYQNKLITNYLKTKLNVVDQKTIKNVLKVNEEVSSKIKKDGFSRNIRWIPKRFEWDNMFSYGEENVIDFSKLNGTVGVFSGNASGKSSICSALSFCLFDKCDRAYKASNILNNQKMSFRCKFQFEIDGKQFFIERSGKSDKKGNVPVKVKFWKIENGEEIELHGEGRRDTNEVIRDYLGSYEDFILTTLSVQSAKNNNSFIDMGQTERKDLLSQFIGLTVFDRLYTFSYDKARELSIILREYKNDDFITQLVNNNNALETSQSAYNETQKEIQTLSNKKEELESKVMELSRGFVNTETTVVDVEISEKLKNKITLDMEKISLEMEKCVDKNDKLSKEIKDIQDQVNDLNKKNIEEIHKNYLDIEEEWKKTKNCIEKKKIVVKSMFDKLEKLSKHEYDPNCKYCMNNIFVKDAIQTKTDLINEKEETGKLLSDFDKLSSKKGELQWVLNDVNKISNLKSTLSSKKDEHHENQVLMSKLEKSFSKLTADLEKVKRDIDFYLNHQKDIESNKNIQKEVDKIKCDLDKISDKQRVMSDKMLELNGKMSLYRSKIEEIKSKVDKAKSIESDYEAYNLYTQCVSRDGIPYDVISSTVPEIEKEVNLILNQMVEFTIDLESDGKNITPYINYDKNRWSLELSSGLERFISTLAIRVALINISNLPRPEFMIIDEGFGCADADNLSSMNTLFDYLKSQFDFVIIISHLDVLKDMVNSRIEISRENGFSKINYI